MVTEEIGLNEDLIRQGIEVWETDLGEFIIQLAGEPPSHIIGPAVHKNKAQIADLFAEKLGVPRVETPEELTRIAREKLRDKFVNADMGITGANAAVAETGSIVLLENEGNIRLCTTIPRIHVALVGIEKVIPTLDDLATLLALLPRSATGQKLSSYTTVITGPRRPGEADGHRGVPPHPAGQRPLAHSGGSGSSGVSVPVCAAGAVSTPVPCTERRAGTATAGSTPDPSARS